MGARMLRKDLAVAVILLFIGMCIVPATGTISELSPKPITTGNTLYVGGTGEGNYTSIQEAINYSFEVDTVYVYDDSSPYFENIIINKSIHLIGENKDTTVIDG